MDMFSTKQEYGKKEIFLLIFLFIPALVAWLTLLFFRDAVITLSCLIGLYYVLSVVYDKFIYDFQWEFYVGKDMIGYKSKLIAGNIFY